MKRKISKIIWCLVLFLLIAGIAVIKKEDVQETIQIANEWLEEKRQAYTSYSAKVAISISCELPAKSYVRDGQVVKFTAYIANYGSSEVNNLTISFTSGGQRVLTDSNVGVIAANEYITKEYKVPIQGSGTFEVKASILSGRYTLAESNGYKLTKTNAKVVLYNTSENLLENPVDVAYKGDTIKGKVEINTGVTFDNSAIFVSGYDWRDQPIEAPEIVRVREGNPEPGYLSTILYKYLNIRVEIPRKLKLNKVSYQDENGNIIEEFDVKSGSLTKESSKIYLNVENNEIIVSIGKLEGNKKNPLLIFDYTVQEGYAELEYTAKASYTSQKYKYLGTIEVEEQVGQYTNVTEMVRYRVYQKQEPENHSFESGRVFYTIGQPELSINQTVASENLVNTTTFGEQANVVFEYTIKNTGEVAATEIVLMNTLPKDVVFQKLLYSLEGKEYGTGTPQIVFEEIDGETRTKLVWEMNELEKSETIRVQIVCQTNLLEVDQEKLEFSNLGTISAKITEVVESNEVESVVVESVTMEDTERQRLTSIQEYCGMYPEIRLQKIEYVGDESLQRPILDPTVSQIDGSIIEHMIYCTEGGETIALATGRAATPSDNYAAGTKERVYELEEIKSKELDEWQDASHGSCVSFNEGHDPRYCIGDHSNAYYRCMGSGWYHDKEDGGIYGHFTETSSYIDSRGKSYENLYDIGFLASFSYDGKAGSEKTWNDYVQMAYWFSCFNDNSFHRSESTETARNGKVFLDYATQYKSFYEDIMDTEDGKKIGMKPESIMDYEEHRLEIQTDVKEGLHKIGPFKIDYVDGRARGEDSSYSFGGITDMYLQDKDGNRINIVNLIKVPENGDEDNDAIKYVHKVDYNRKGGDTFFSNWDEPEGKEGIENVNLIDWWDWEKSYPRPNETFYVEISNDWDIWDTIDEDYLAGKLELKFEFQYIKCTALLCKRKGITYQIKGVTRENVEHHHDCFECEDPCCDYCVCYLEVDPDVPSQSGVLIMAAEREYITEEFSIPFEYDTTDEPEIITRMKIGGFVFQDQEEQDKDGGHDGKRTQSDLNLENIEVRLYYAETDELVELGKLIEEKPTATEAEINDPNDYTRRTNPTLTDSKGYYEFRGVDVSKKYYIEYTYNGQTYTPTDYMDVSQLEKLQSDNSSHGTTEEWQQASKGTERETERTEFDLKFSSIGSYPNNYPSDNNLGINLPSDKGKQYNKTFTEYNLVGIELNSSGKYVYKNNNIQLVDTYLTIEDGIVIDTANPLSGRETEIKYGWISKTIRNYVKNLDINGNTISGTYQNLEHKYPTDEIMKDYIYKQIVDKLVSFGEDQQVTWEKLQFIEDCQISSYTKPIDAEDIKDFVNYPYGDYYTIAITKGPKYPNNSYKDGTYVDGASIGNEYPNIIMKHNGTLEGHDKMTVAYNNIYPGHLFINLGLLERNELDVALEKDVYKATLKINGKTHVYEYNERDVITPEEKAELARLHKEAGRNSLEYLQYQTALDSKYWEIQTRITDYETYYDDATYNRELYSSDINFNGTDNLEVYVTYKITIRNQSQMLLAQIDELVDYYDETYEPVLDKSWVMYKENSTDDNQAVYVFDQDFYDIMVEDRKVGDGEKYRSITSNGYNTQTGKYAQNTRYKLDGYQTLYVDGLKDKKLVSGESAYVYLTFKVENEGKDLQKDLNKAKHNIIEINGYTSYYQDGIELPNGYNVKNGKLYRGSKQIRNIAYAGLIDHDSTPGNFREELMDKNGRYEHNFEDDTDRARAITIKLDREAQRIISGVAWEDKRDTKVDEALIGNGIRQNGEVTIEGIQVELLEVQLDEDGNASFDSNGDIRTKGIAKLYQANGSTVNAVTKTDRNGNYQFKGFIPGDYIVRFTYGEEFNAHYNGQDYKTTTYQIGIDQTNGRTDVAKPEDPGYEGYTDLGNYGDSGRNYGDNASGTYGYDIFEADYNSKGNVSDAKDLWRLRSAVNKDNSQNYSGVTNTYATDLNNNDTPNSVAITQMIADTGVIRAEFEYNRQHSKTNGLDNNDYGGTSTGENEYLGGNNGEANNKNATYHIKNVDLGLEERPKAQLEINKQVNNVKIVLANQNVLFDANKTATNLIWQSKIPYNINDEKEETKYDNKAQRVTAGSNEVYSDYTRYNDFRQYVIDTIDTRLRNSSGIIQATMDEELMHGATIQITYDITVENIGEVDYKETSFYYTGKIGNKNTEVRTSADVILDYVSNNLQFRTENNKNEWGWKTITTGDIQRLDYVDDDLERAKKLEEFNTIISTGSLKKALLPLTSKRESGSKDTSISTQLVLTQTITAENDNDDLTYGNLAEIVKISNDVGRRMAFSVQGNQDPTKPDSITEPDTSKAERVVILPPFGSEYVYYGLAALVMALLAIGIIIIKKVVLPKNK